jgi:hypothetical protein
MFAAGFYLDFRCMLETWRPGRGDGLILYRLAL